MIKTFTLLIVCYLILQTAVAQSIAPAVKTYPVKADQPFGKVDTADLTLKQCDFEKDANAMVLFDQAKSHYRFSSIIIERHKRIKIFNDKGKDVAKVRIEYYGVHNDESVSDLEAQTINLTNVTIF